MAIIKPLSEEAIVIQDLPAFASDPTIQVQMLRLDAIHPIISGNKWFKLKYNIQEALQQDAKGIVTFGGAFSNHLIATAAAAYYAGISSVGIVRGIYSSDTLNPVLQQCAEYEMQLHFVSRSEYAQKNESDVQLLFPHHFIIPEGGANDAGRKGAGEIAAFIPAEYSHILVSVGSATTFIGMRNSLPVEQHLMGFAPLKGGVYLKEVIEQHLLSYQNKNWQLTDAFHFGGFGKINPDIICFMDDFRQRYGFELDRVYTAKMMMGLQQKLAEGFFAKGSKILCVHSGGLTGN